MSGWSKVSLQLVSISPRGWWGPDSSIWESQALVLTTLPVHRCSGGHHTGSVAPLGFCSTAVWLWESCSTFWFGVASLKKQMVMTGLHFDSIICYLCSLGLQFSCLWNGVNLYWMDEKKNRGIWKYPVQVLAHNWYSLTAFLPCFRQPSLQRIHQNFRKCFGWLSLFSPPCLLGCCL